MSLGLSDALSRLGISSGPAAAAVQEAEDVQAAAPLAAPTKATTSVSLGQNLKPLRRGLILTPELDHGAVLGRVFDFEDFMHMNLRIPACRVLANR